MDTDSVETTKWTESLRAVIQNHGLGRASFILDQLRGEAQRAGVVLPFTVSTAYIDTIPPEREERVNWDRDIEHRIRSIIRWNAIAIILRANKESSELGGHIASFQSAATLYDIGLGHFWRAPSEQARWRPHLHTGTFGAGYLRARFPRRAPFAPNIIGATTRDRLSVAQTGAARKIA
jgi:pyruvate dehydrogenase complex dehydrogenase (E1) component